MKIGHLIHLDGSGGGPEAIINLVRGLSGYGFDQVVFHGGQGRLAAFCDESNIAHVRLPFERKSKLFYGTIRLIQLFYQTKPDIVFLHGQWAGPAGALAASLARVKTIYVTHWPAFYTDWTPFRAWRNAWAEWIPCRLACRVVALSPSVHYQYLYRGWAHGGKLVMIPNIFSLSDLPSQEDAARIREKYGWDSGHVHVVSVGRLVDQKKVDWLLKAWVIVQQRRPCSRLWIVGDGIERTRLEALSVKLGIDESCKFLGAVSRGIDFLAAADIVAMTSLYESWGYVALEAKACGKPLVANAVDGLRDNVRDRIEGYCVPPGEVQEMAQRLTELIDNPGLRLEMGMAGRKAVSGQDSRAVLDCYHQLIRMACAR